MNQALESGQGFQKEVHQRRMFCENYSDTAIAIMLAGNVTLVKYDSWNNVMSYSSIDLLVILPVYQTPWIINVKSCDNFFAFFVVPDSV